MSEKKKRKQKRNNNYQVYYTGEMEKQSRILLSTAKKTMEDMESYYPTLLKDKNPEDIKDEVEGRKEALKRTKKNIIKAYEMMFDISDELSGRWADILSASKKGGGRKRKVNADIDLYEMKTNPFARGINLYKILWIIFIGSFAGVIIEMAWCLLRNGYIESRRGMVWGPFNFLYGAGAALLSITLYRFRNHGQWVSFLGGMIVGSVLEYFCSWAQELIIGSRSWDYSNVPFNINGRICLLYSVFWGILGVVWIKRIFPLVSSLIQKIPGKIAKPLTWACVIFFVVDLMVSGLAVWRWSKRLENIPPQNIITETIDNRFDDERMERIFPNMVFGNE